MSKVAFFCFFVKLSGLLLTNAPRTTTLIIVVENKKAVIITDGTGPIQEMAGSIAAIVGGYQGYVTAVVPAESFSGVDLLPAHAVFLGCESPKPPSFQYIEALFKHINLAGRSCGVFSSNTKTLKYLSTLIRDCESTVTEPFMAKGGAAGRNELKKWIKGILK